MMLLCIRLEPRRAGEETRTLATGRRRQRDNSTMTLPIGRQRKEKEKAKHQPRENPPRRTRTLVRLKWIDARQKVLDIPNIYNVPTLGHNVSTKLYGSCPFSYKKRALAPTTQQHMFCWRNIKISQHTPQAPTLKLYVSIVTE